MPAWLLPLLLGGTAFGGGMIPRKSKAESTSKSTSEMLPFEMEEWGPLNQLLMSQMMRKLQFPGADLSGYKATGIQDINTVYDLIQKSTENRLASAGLLSSPIAGTATSEREIARGGEIARFTAGLPLVKRQMELEDLNQILGYWAMRPMGQKTTTTGTGTQTTTAGGGIGGGFSSLATMLGWLFGMGKLGGGGGGTTGGFGGLSMEELLTTIPHG